MLTEWGSCVEYLFWDFSSSQREILKTGEGGGISRVPMSTDWPFAICSLIAWTACS